LALRGIKIFLQTGLDDSKITALEQPSDLPVGQLEILPTRAFRDAVTIVLAPHRVGCKILSDPECQDACRVSDDGSRH
jgi:hypothetical protein